MKQEYTIGLVMQCDCSICSVLASVLIVPHLSTYQVLPRVRVGPEFNLILFKKVHLLVRNAV